MDTETFKTSLKTHLFKLVIDYDYVLHIWPLGGEVLHAITWM